MKGLRLQGAGTCSGKLGLEQSTCSPWRRVSLTKGLHGHHSYFQHPVDTGCAEEGNVHHTLGKYLDT